MNNRYCNIHNDEHYDISIVFWYADNIMHNRFIRCGECARQFTGEVSGIMFEWSNVPSHSTFCPTQLDTIRYNCNEMTDKHFAKFTVNHLDFWQAIR